MRTAKPKQAISAIVLAIGNVRVCTNMPSCTIPDQKGSIWQRYWHYETLLVQGGSSVSVTLVRLDAAEVRKFIDEMPYAKN